MSINLYMRTYNPMGPANQTESGSWCAGQAKMAAGLAVGESLRWSHHWFLAITSWQRCPRAFNAATVGISYKAGKVSTRKESTIFCIWQLKYLQRKISSHSIVYNNIICAWLLWLYFYVMLLA